VVLKLEDAPESAGGCFKRCRIMVLGYNPGPCTC
jgi:hypothetical protein